MGPGRLPVPGPALVASDCLAMELTAQGCEGAHVFGPHTDSPPSTAIQLLPHRVSELRVAKSDVDVLVLTFWNTLQHFTVRCSLLCETATPSVTSSSPRSPSGPLAASFVFHKLLNAVPRRPPLALFSWQMLTQRHLSHSGLPSNIYGASRRLSHVTQLREMLLFFLKVD